MTRGYVVEVERRAAEGPAQYERHVCRTVAAVVAVVERALQRRRTSRPVHRREAGEASAMRAVPPVRTLGGGLLQAEGEGG